MKRCFKCGEEKPLDEFYKHKQMADGHVNKCKICNKKDVHENRVLQIDKIRAYDRKRGRTKRRIKQCSDRLKIWRIKNPEKYAAHSAANNAIRDGLLVKQPCAVCGTDSNIQKHHHDYNKPLDVVFLCPIHHKRAHGLGLDYE